MSSKLEAEQELQRRWSASFAASLAGLAKRTHAAAHTWAQPAVRVPHAPYPIVTVQQSPTHQT